MSISFEGLESVGGSNSVIEAFPPRRIRVSQKKIEANRRNAQRSTGPKSKAGKMKVSLNALKHGLCADSVRLPGECEATFNIFKAELAEDLQPRTAIQHLLMNPIANLIWQLRRIPEAQAKIFDQEMTRLDCTGETLSAADVMARRFSDEANNGFAVLHRYERSLQSALLRMLKQFQWQKKHLPHTPWPDDEPRVPREPACRARYAGLSEGSQVLAEIRAENAAKETTETPRRHGDGEGENKPKSNPPENAAGESEMQIWGEMRCIFLTEQSQTWEGHQWPINSQ